MPAHQGGRMKRKKRTKATSFSLFWHTDVRSAVLHPPTGKAAFGDPSPSPHQNDPGKQKRSRLRSLDLCSAQQQTNGNGSPPASEVCLAPLHSGKGCQGKYEGATSAATHSHLKQPGLCLLDISSPPILSPFRWVQYGHISCSTSPCLTDILGFFRYFKCKCVCVCVYSAANVKVCWQEETHVTVMGAKNSCCSARSWTWRKPQRADKGFKFLSHWQPNRFTCDAITNKLLHWTFCSYLYLSFKRNMNDMSHEVNNRWTTAHTKTNYSKYFYKKEGFSTT